MESIKADLIFFIFKCKYVYVCVHLFKHIHTHTHTHTHTHIYNITFESTNDPRFDVLSLW